MSIRSSQSIMLLKYFILLLIFCLLVLSIIESKVLKSQTIIMDLYISLCTSNGFFFMQFGVLLLSGATCLELPCPLDAVTPLYYYLTFVIPSNTLCFEIQCGNDIATTVFLLLEVVQCIFYLLLFFNFKNDFLIGYAHKIKLRSNVMSNSAYSLCLEFQGFCLCVCLPMYRGMWF